MAFRTWLKLLLATLGVAALAGASQLGLAYGLGIVRLTRVLDITTRDQWTAQLAWVAWFAMVAAVVGAAAGALLLPRWGPARAAAPTPAAPADSTDSPAAWPTSVSPARPPEPPAPSVGTTIALAVAAGIGAAVVVPLTMQPARTAQIDGVNPVVVIGICATLGAIVGIFAACAALVQAVTRWSLATVGIAVWVIAIVSVSPSLAPSDPLPAVRLGVFDAGFLSPATTQRTALFTMPAIALLAGAALGWRARRQERSTLAIALAGLPGPALLTLSYLIAGPGAGDDRYQVVPYWAAMTATGAGVLGSVLAAVLRRGAGPDDTDDEPTEGLPTLPQRTSRTESQIAQANQPPPAEGGESDGPGRPGDVPQTGTRPSDTAVFDAPTGQIRPAPVTGRAPLAAPWSPTASGASAPLTAPDGRQPGTFPARTSDYPGSGGVALGEYADQEPVAFDGFARGMSPRSAPGRGQHAAPEQAAGFAAGASYVPGPAAGFAVSDQAKPYVPEPATRPLPPEVLGQVPLPAPLPQPTPISPPPRQPEPLTSTPEAEQPSGPAAKRGRFGFGRTAPAPRTEPDEIAPSTGRHGAAPTSPQPVDKPDKPDDGGGRRFGLKKHRDNNDYVDWVSGLSND